MFKSISNWFRRRSHRVTMVFLEVDGGGNGDSRLPPNYSYRLIDMVTGTVIRSKVSPLKPRPIGRFLPGYIGLAIDLYGQLELWDPCEVAETGPMAETRSPAAAASFRN